MEQADTPCWLDMDLSLRSRRILFGLVAVVTLYATMQYVTCPEGEEADLLSDLANDGCAALGGPYWGWLVVAGIAAICCCPCLSIMEHGEYYKLFPLMKMARDRQMKMVSERIQERRAQQIAEERFRSGMGDTRITIDASPKVQL